MVRNYVRTTNRAATYTREQLLEAVDKVKNGELTAYRAAIAYEIPRPTIVARVYEKYGLKSKSLGRNTAIPEETENKLAENLHEMEKYGFGLTRTEIMEVVGDYVTKNNIETPFKNGIPGEDWFLAFKKRHNLTVKKPQAVENSRKKACNPWVIYSYYELLKNTMDELGLHDKPSHIWNLDETSFSKDPSKTKVVGLRGYASTRTIASPGKDNTTVLLGCSAAGGKTPPLIIFKAKNLWDEWTSEEDYPGTVYAATKNGWMETNVFETYFEKVFLPTVGQKRPILLVYDGHSTHVGINIIEKARAAGITIMKIPPHTSDNLQPLDLAVNKSFKDKWDLMLVKWQRLHVGQALPKKEFSKLIGVVWAQVDPKVCEAGFRKAGIFPFNSNAVPEEKFNPHQLAEWKKQQEQSIGLNEITTTSDDDVLKSLDRGSSDEPFSSCSKNQITGLRQTEIQSGNNVLYTNDPYPISIPSLQSICLNYWNYAIERTTDHKSVSDDRRISPSCKIALPQSFICDMRSFKKVGPDHNVSKNVAKTSLMLSKVTVIEDRHFTFEELLLQKINAGGHSKQKRTKIAGGAEVITSEDVYKKQKNIEEEKSKKLKLREEKLANKRKNDENTTTGLYKDSKKTKTGDSTSESKIKKQLLIDEDSKDHDDNGKLREEKLVNKRKKDANMKTRLCKDKKRTNTGDSTKERKINNQLRDEDSKHYDGKTKLRQFKRFENSHRKKGMKQKKIKKLKTADDSTSESDFEMTLMDDSDIEGCETWITEDSTSESEVNKGSQRISKDDTYIKDIPNYEDEIVQNTEIDSMENSDIYDSIHNTNKENYNDELVENDYDEPPTSTVDKGQWVLVKFSTKTSIKHYVGVVTDVNSDSIPTIKFARKSFFKSSRGGDDSRNTFVFPHVPDICDVTHLEDIVCKLPEPMIDRRGKLSFKISFQSFNVQ